jgi:hypothetical protein
MPQGDEERERWARRTAERLIEGILGATERTAGPHLTVDQIGLLREIARRALWHMPSSNDEAREMVRYIDEESLKQAHPGDDEPPWA